MTWHLERMGIFDTETSAPNPEEARLVSACVGNVGGGGDKLVRQTIVNPGVEIPQGAIDVHGITNERARAEGIEPGAAVEGIVWWLGETWATGSPVIAYNAPYDFTVLDREARRHLGHGIEIGGPVVDPFVIDRQVDKFRKGKRTLTVTAAHYGVALNGAHDATEDALAAGRVAWAIAQKYPQIAAMSLEELHEAQIGWHAAKQAGFAKYLREKGESADDVFGDWPMRPLAVGVPA